MPKLDEPFRDHFYNLSFSSVQIWVLRAKEFFMQFLVDILPVGSGSVNPQFFFGSGSRKPKPADSTDPDPKH